jgi:dihydroneopterin aldolase
MKIHLEKFQFETIIGILDFEREEKQKIEIDIVLEYEYVENFLNYAELRELVKEFIKERKFGLLEDALIETTEEIKSKFEISYLKLKISKLEIFEDAIVSLEMEWKDDRYI